MNLIIHAAPTVADPLIVEVAPLTDRVTDLVKRAQHAQGSLAAMYASHQALVMVEELAGMVAELAKARG